MALAVAIEGAMPATAATIGSVGQKEARLAHKRCKHDLDPTLPTSSPLSLLLHFCLLQNRHLFQNSVPRRLVQLEQLRILDSTLLNFDVGVGAVLVDK